MALTHGYGVVVGTVQFHQIELPDDEGRWPHYQIFVATPAGIYECVINLKSRTEVKIKYRDFRDGARPHFASILALPDGFHPLPSAPGSGALDVIRHPGLRDLICPPQRPPFSRALAPKPVPPERPQARPRARQCSRWWLESGLNVVELTEYYLAHVHRVYIFGEPYTTDLGLHNVHMNQGDPVGSPFAVENAIWQDGGVILQYVSPQPRLSIMVTKFEAQSLTTDSAGRPR